jgi:hypothetical protein
VSEHEQQRSVICRCWLRRRGVGWAELAKLRGLLKADSDDDGLSAAAPK